MEKEVSPVKKRKYDSEDSKRRLIRAGIDVFSEEGYDAATTRGIAKKAGVNESLIQRYFENKQGLFFAILKEFHERLSTAPVYPHGDDLQKELMNFFNFRIDFSKSKKKFMKLAIVRAILDGKVREQLGGLIRNGTPGLTSRLEKLRAEGKVRTDVNLDHVGMLASGIAFSMSMFTYVIFDLDREFIDDILQLASKVLANGLKKE